MKATLHKMLSGYLLSLNGDIDDPYAIVNEQLADDYGWYKLSLKNCQAIERGYDLDELAKTIFPDKIFTTDEEHEIPVDGPPYQWGFKVGFQKALELIGDKKFSEEDVKNIFAKTLENAPSTESHTRMISDEQYRYFIMNELYDRITKSLQPTEWDVEIEMDICGDKVYEVPEPKLDENGCLILKKI